MKKIILGLGLSFLAAGANAEMTYDSVSSLQKRSVEAAHAFIDIMNSSRAIPVSVLNRATCIATFPKVIKAGFIFGGEMGKGFVSCRTGQGWSQTAALEFRSASAGFQFGARRNKMVMVFTSPRAAQQLASNKLTFGADLSYSIGPIADRTGRHDDFRARSDVYVYALSRGIMIDLSLNGAHLDADQSDTRKLHGHGPLAALMTPSQGADSYFSALSEVAE